MATSSFFLAAPDRYRSCRKYRFKRNNIRSCSALIRSRRIKAATFRSADISQIDGSTPACRQGLDRCIPSPASVPSEPDSGPLPGIERAPPSSRFEASRRNASSFGSGETRLSKSVYRFIIEAVMISNGVLPVGSTADFDIVTASRANCCSRRNFDKASSCSVVGEVHWHAAGHLHRRNARPSSRAVAMR